MLAGCGHSLKWEVIRLRFQELFTKWLSTLKESPSLGTIPVTTSCMIRADSRFAPSQWELSLQSNAVSHWLGANLETALMIYPIGSKVKCETAMWHHTVVLTHKQLEKMGANSALWQLMLWCQVSAERYSQSWLHIYCIEPVSYRILHL